MGTQQMRKDLAIKAPIRLDIFASWMAENRKNEDGSPKFLYLPNMAKLGLEKAAELSRGQRLAHTIAGESPEISGAYTYAQEVSRGKDTLSGHWEMMGVPVDFEWVIFPINRTAFLRNWWKQL